MTKIKLELEKNEKACTSSFLKFSSCMIYRWVTCQIKFFSNKKKLILLEISKSQILVDSMATRKHAKHASIPATSRPTTGSSTTDTPTTTSAPTNRPSRSSRTPTTNAQADSTTPSNTTAASSRPPVPPRLSSENTSRTQTPTISVTSGQRSADGDATTSTGKKSIGSTDDGADKKVIVITNKSEFDRNLEQAGNKLVLVEFFASWCGPCRLLSPKLEQLANDYEDKVFVMKMDVDECEEVPMEYGISSMPTFLFMRNKKKIELFVGSNSEKLINRLERLCDPTKTLTSAPSNLSIRPPASGEPSASNIKSNASKRKPEAETEESAASSTATTSTPTSSSGKKTAAK